MEMDARSKDTAKKVLGKSKRNSRKKIGSDIAATTMKNAKNGLFSIMALIPMFLPQITTGMNSTILQTPKAAKHPHCIRNTAFAKAQHRRKRGGICGKHMGMVLMYSPAVIASLQYHP